MSIAIVSPDSFQTSALQWIGVATVVGGALAVFATFVLTKIGEIKRSLQAQREELGGRLDRQGATLTAQQVQLANVAIATPPPAGIATVPAASIIDATMGKEGMQGIAPLGASIPPLAISKTLAVILCAAITFSGCASLTPGQRATGAKIWRDVVAVAEIGGEAAAGYYGGAQGQQVATALFDAANQAAAGKLVTAQTVQGVVTAAGGEPALASLAAAELDKSGALTPKQAALVINTIGAAVQQVSNVQAK